MSLHAARLFLHALAIAWLAVTGSTAATSAVSSWSLLPRPATAGMAGDFQIHADSCAEPLLSGLRLERSAQGGQPICSETKLAASVGAGARNLGVQATGDPRDGRWALARMTFSK